MKNTFKFPQNVMALALSPEGDRIFATTESNELFILSSDKLQVMEKFPLRQVKEPICALLPVAHPDCLCYVTASGFGVGFLDSFRQEKEDAFYQEFLNGDAVEVQYGENVFSCLLFDNPNDLIRSVTPDPFHQFAPSLQVRPAGGDGPYRTMDEEVEGALKQILAALPNNDRWGEKDPMFKAYYSNFYKTQTFIPYWYVRSADAQRKIFIPSTRMRLSRTTLKEEGRNYVPIMSGEHLFYIENIRLTDFLKSPQGPIYGAAASADANLCLFSTLTGDIFVADGFKTYRTARFPQPLELLLVKDAEHWFYAEGRSLCKESLKIQASAVAVPESPRQAYPELYAEHEDEEAAVLSRVIANYLSLGYTFHDPDITDALFLLGCRFQQLGMREEAFRCLSKAAQDVNYSPRLDSRMKKRCIGETLADSLIEVGEMQKGAEFLLETDGLPELPDGRYPISEELKANIGIVQAEIRLKKKGLEIGRLDGESVVDTLFMEEENYLEGLTFCFEQIEYLKDELIGNRTLRRDHMVRNYASQISLLYFKAGLFSLYLSQESGGDSEQARLLDTSIQCLETAVDFMRQYVSEAPGLESLVELYQDIYLENETPILRSVSLAKRLLTTPDFSNANVLGYNHYLRLNAKYQFAKLLLSGMPISGAEKLTFLNTRDRLELGAEAILDLLKGIERFMEWSINIDNSLIGVHIQRKALNHLVDLFMAMAKKKRSLDHILPLLLNIIENARAVTLRQKFSKRRPAAVEKQALDLALREYYYPTHQDASLPATAAGENAWEKAKQALINLKLASLPESTEDSRRAARPQRVSMEQYRDHMPENELVVSYWEIVPDEYVCLSFDREELVCRRICFKENVRQTLGTSRNKPENVRGALASAYAKLLSPLLQPFAAKDKNSLVILPDGQLHALPFEALLTRAQSDADSFPNWPFLFKEFSVSYRFSLAESTRKPGDGFDALLGIADPAFTRPQGEEIQSDISNGSFNGEPLQRLVQEILGQAQGQWRGISRKRLTDTRLELALLEGLASEQGIPVTRLEGPDATADNMRHELNRLEGNNALLYIGTHGKGSDSFPEFSSLALALDGAAGDRPTLFSFFDALQGDFSRVGLAFLGACESAGGAELAGEGVLAFPWALLHRGAGNVIASVWRIGGKWMPLCVLETVKGLFQGMSPLDALNQAKVEILKTGDPSILEILGGLRLYSVPPPHGEEDGYEVSRTPFLEAEDDFDDSEDEGQFNDCLSLLNNSMGTFRDESAMSFEELIELYPEREELYLHQKRKKEAGIRDHNKLSDAEAAGEDPLCRCEFCGYFNNDNHCRKHDIGLSDSCFCRHFQPRK